MVVSRSDRMNGNESEISTKMEKMNARDGGEREDKDLVGEKSYSLYETLDFNLCTLSSLLARLFKTARKTVQDLLSSCRSPYSRLLSFEIETSQIERTIFERMSVSFRRRQCQSTVSSLFVKSVFLLEKASNDSD